MSGAFSFLLGWVRAEMGRLLTGETTPVPRRAPPPCPGASSLCSQLQDLGRAKGAHAQVHGQPLPLRLPTLRVLGEVRGQRPGPGATLPPGPGPGTWRPESPGSGDIGCVCGVCKYGCVCVHMLLFSLGICRAGLEEVGNRRISSSISSGKEGIGRRGL